MMIENIKRTMLEKVAEAISISFREEGYIENESDPDEWKEFLRAAKAAITAMREPTLNMQKAACNDYMGYDRQGPTKPPWNCDTMWKAMINAALEEK